MNCYDVAVKKKKDCIRRTTGMHCYLCDAVLSGERTLYSVCDNCYNKKRIKALEDAAVETDDMKARILKLETRVTHLENTRITRNYRSRRDRRPVN